MSRHITQNAFWVVLAAILIGLFIPVISHALRPYTFGFLFVVMICALMRLTPPAQVINGDKPPMLKLLFWQLFFTPVIVWGVVTVMGLEAPIAAALIACACAGPVFSTPAFARLTGLDAGLTIQNLIASSFLMPLSLVLAGYFLLPLQPDIDLETFALRVGLFLCVPFIAGYCFRKLTSPGFQEKSGAPILSISTLSLALMACSLMDGIAAKAISAPMEMAFLIVLAVGFNLSLQAATTYLFKGAGANFAINAGMVCGYRNWALTLALTAGTLGEEFTAFVAIGQFGVMLMPLPTIRFYKSLIREPKLQS